VIWRAVISCGLCTALSPTFRCIDRAWRVAAGPRVEHGVVIHPDSSQLRPPSSTMIAIHHRRTDECPTSAPPTIHPYCTIWNTRSSATADGLRDVLSVKISPTRPVCDSRASCWQRDRLAVAKFSKSRVRDKVPEGSTVIFGDGPTQLSLQHRWKMEKKTSMPKTSSIRPVVSIQYRLVTDGQTDRRRQQILHQYCSRSRSDLVVKRPTAVWEDPGSNLTADGCVYRDSHCDVRPWARAAHLYCSA